MEKGNWIGFLASKIQSQIQLENARKMRTILLGLVSVGVLGYSLNAVGHFSGRMFFQTSKLMFILFYHGLMVLMVYLPMQLRKGEKSLAGFWGIKDFTGLVLISSGMAFYSLIALLLSFQIAGVAGDLSSAGFLAVVAWLNVAVLFFYAAGFAVFFAGLLWFPAFLSKGVPFVSRSVPVLMGIHAVLLALLGSGYTDNVKLGSPAFFEQFFVMALFWAFIVGSLLFLGRLLDDSAIPALSALELDLFSGKAEKEQEILERYRNAYTPARFSAWIDRLSGQSVTLAKDIRRYAQEAIALVSREKPTEIDLYQVEDRYKRAESLCKRLEKSGQRFQAGISVMDTHVLQQAKIEYLRDQYSRDSRNARLELAGVRKRIDERLVALKNAAIAEAAAMVPPAPPTQAEIPAVKQPAITK